jgi:hypothetical protein
MLDQQPVASRVGTEAAARQHRAVLVDRLDRHALLVWVHTHDHSAHLLTSCLEPSIGEDGQSYFEPGNPLLSHASPRHTRRDRMPDESHTREGGQPRL